MIQDLYERSKRDSSSSGSDSNSSGSSSGSDSSSSSSSDGDSTTPTPVDECALLADYIATDLAAFPANNFNNLLFNIPLANRVAPVFFDLLTSAPTLFADLSRAIDAASSLTPEEAGVSALNALSPDFIALARDSCGIALRPVQERGIVGLFFAILLTFFFFQ